MSDTIVLNGISWDKENLVIDGQTAFNHIESIIIAYQLGKRLPTKNELDELRILPHSWDKNKKGMWFAEKEENLRTDKSLFLEFAGYYYNENYSGSYDCHWTISPISTTAFPYRLYFYNPDCNMLSTNNGYLGTIRCVSNIKQ